MVRFLLTRSDTIAHEFTELFYREIKFKFDTPTGIVSDQNNKITSKSWTKVYYHALIKSHLSTAFYPQINGQTEIFNKILKYYLHVYTSDKQIN